MNKYTKMIVTLVILLAVSTVGFGSAFGYGGGGSYTENYTYQSTPVITLAPVVVPVVTPVAPIVAPVGQVLGQNSMSMPSFVNLLINIGAIPQNMIAFWRIVFGL